MSAIPQLRICLVTDSTEPSGVGRHILDLAEGLSAGHRVVVAAPAAPLARRLLRGAHLLDAEVWELPDAGPRVIADALRQRLAAEPVDLVHVHAGIAWEGHEVAGAARAAGVGAIIRTEHCPYVLTNDLDARRYAHGIDAVDEIICVSHGVRGSFVDAGVAPERLRVVLNGVADRPPRASRAEIRSALGVADGARMAVTVARLTEQKGHRDLITAVPAVLSRVPGTRFIWVGDGPLEGTIRAALRDAGLENDVALLPHHDDVPGLLAAADVVVLPSRFEGLPLVALEAMAAARPVVGTAVIGLVETIRDRRTGRLVNPGDAEGLGAAIAEVLADPQLAETWGAAGHDWQRRAFTTERMVASTLRIYQGLLDRDSGEVLISMAAAL